MAYNYAYSPVYPPWHFMEMPMMQPRRHYRPRSRHREYDYDYDPIRMIADSRRQLDELEKMFKKEEKKEEKKNPNLWEKVQLFAGQLGGMILIGFPAGYVALTLFNEMMKRLFN